MPSTTVDSQSDSNAVDTVVITKHNDTVNTDSTISSTHTYVAFVDRLHDTSCLTILTHVRKFIHGMYDATQKHNANISSLITSYHTFFRFIMARLLHNDKFDDMNEQDIIWVRVAMECLLTTELYPIIFGRWDGDVQRDDYFYRKLAQHSKWITNEHLDLKYSPDLTEASQELIRISIKRTPTDKLDCLVRSIQSVQSKLNADNNVTSADDLLPTVILLLIRTNPPRIHSCLQYILRFWEGGATNGNGSTSPININEAEYCLTTFFAAMAFIERMRAETFHMDTETYSKLCDDTVTMLNKELLWAESDEEHVQSSANLDPQIMDIVRLTANKSIASVRKFMSEAEDVVRSTFNNIKERQHLHNASCQHHKHHENLNSEDDEEYQLQLAMALSLSALDCADVGASDAIHENGEAGNPINDNVSSIRSPKNKDTISQNDNDIKNGEDETILVDSNKESEQ